MRCPYCKNEIEYGFVQSNKEIIYTNSEKNSPLVWARKGDVRLTPGFWGPATCSAWHCPGCRKVIIEYGPDQVKV